MLANDFSNGSIDYLSSLVEFSHLDTLSLTLNLSEESFNSIKTIVNNLLDRTYNIQSIHLRSTRSKDIVEYLKIICPMILNQVKHLTLDIENMHEIRCILGQFENFSSIKFEWKISDSSVFHHAIEELNRKGRDFTYFRDPWMNASFWFGKQKLNN